MEGISQLFTVAIKAAFPYDTTITVVPEMPDEHKSLTREIIVIL